MKEKDLYPDIIDWIEKYLKDRHPHSQIKAYDTHNKKLSNFIFELNLQDFFPEFIAFDMKIDITTIVKSKNKVKLAFIECKIKPISLKDIGQILGYSRVAKPEYSFIISPNGISTPLKSLLITFGRYDILEYDDGKKIKIAKWNLIRKEIDSQSLLPPGEHII